jgi:hypothetical protein
MAPELHQEIEEMAKKGKGAVFKVYRIGNQAAAFPLRILNMTE